MASTPPCMWDCQHARSAGRVILQVYKPNRGRQAQLRDWSLSYEEFAQMRQAVERCGAEIDHARGEAS